MTDTNVFQLVQPGTFTDRLTEVLRAGARTLLAQAVEIEVADFIAMHADKRTAHGHRRLVRHGALHLLPLEDDQFRGYGPMQRIHVQVDGWLPNMYRSSQIGIGCPFRILW